MHKQIANTAESTMKTEPPVSNEDVKVLLKLVTDDFEVPQPGIRYGDKIKVKTVSHPLFPFSLRSQSSTEDPT